MASSFSNPVLLAYALFLNSVTVALTDNFDLVCRPSLASFGRIKLKVFLPFHSS